MVSPQRQSPTQEWQSPLSVPIPGQNIMCNFQKCGMQTADNTTDPESKIDSNKQTNEQTILERAMAKLSIHEKTNLQRGIMGDSVTSSTILQRWSGEGLAEGPVFLKLKFAELEDHIQKRIASKQGGRSYEAYQMARAQDEQWINRPEFKITFLRATHYDTKKATTKILWYFDVKLELFGAKALGRDIYWDDLSPEGKDYLERGDMQLLPQRDRFGRKIVMWSDTYGSKVLTHGEVFGVRQAQMYFMTNLGEHDNEPGRTKGYVYLRWGVHCKELPDWAIRNFYEIYSSWHGWCPCKLASVHHCYPPLLECFHWINKGEMLSMFDSYLTKFKRFIVHYGTELQCKDQMLKGYGFPVDSIPISYDGIKPFHTRHVAQWIAERHHIEQWKKDAPRTSSSSSSSLSVVQKMLLTPEIEADFRHDEDAFFRKNGSHTTDDSVSKTLSDSVGSAQSILSENHDETMEKIEKLALSTKATDEDQVGIHKADVLLVQGMNSALRIQPGNIRFRKLIEDQYPTYSAYQKKSQKTKLSEQIVRKVAGWGGRFMKWDPEQGVWTEVDFIEARKKVATTFRDVTKAIKRRAK